MALDDVYLKALKSVAVAAKDAADRLSAVERADLMEAVVGAGFDPAVDVQSLRSGVTLAEATIGAVRDAHARMSLARQNVRYWGDDVEVGRVRWLKLLAVEQLLAPESAKRKLWELRQTLEERSPSLQDRLAMLRSVLPRFRAILEKHPGLKSMVEDQQKLLTSGEATELVVREAEARLAHHEAQGALPHLRRELRQFEVRWQSAMEISRNRLPPLRWESLRLREDEDAASAHA